MTTNTPHAIPDGRHEINGATYMKDAKGGYQPIETIKAQHLLEDECVRKILGYAIPLSDQVTRFKEHTFGDIGAHEAILAQEYGAKLGGKKGNKTLQTFDGLFKVQVAVADRLEFGPELQAAKSLFDECVNDWAVDAPAELRGLVTDAFETDKEGSVNRTRMFMLLRYESADSRWQEAQRAIRDAMRVVGSKTYIRCYRRATHDVPWEMVSIDLARA